MQTFPAVSSQFLEDILREPESEQPTAEGEQDGDGGREVCLDGDSDSDCRFRPGQLTQTQIRLSRPSLLASGVIVIALLFLLDHRVGYC